MRYAAATRAKALEAGLWTTHRGAVVPLARLHDAHLVNALLRSLADAEPEGITGPLAAEVTRRGLADAAWAEAQRRTWMTEIRPGDRLRLWTRYNRPWDVVVRRVTPTGLWVSFRDLAPTVERFINFNQITRREVTR